MKVIRIPADSTQAPSVIETDDFQSVYDALNKGVGGWIEAVDLGENHIAAPNHTMYVNEEGKINGLPFNDRATSLTRGVLSPFDMVVGDVVIVGPVDDEGDDTEVSAQALEHFGL